jgi:hypothetical protein
VRVRSVTKRLGLGKLDAQTFTRLLGAGEIALGASLLLPIVPTALAGLGLAGFSTGLLGLYLRIPGMRQDGSLRPTAQGTPSTPRIPGCWASACRS